VSENRQCQIPGCPPDLPPSFDSKVFDTYWRFAAERQEIFFRRIAGARSLDPDPVLREFKFTNAYRASDRVSQYLIRRGILCGDQILTTYFQDPAVKNLHRIETWELLEESWVVSRSQPTISTATTPCGQRDAAGSGLLGRLHHAFRWTERVTAGTP